jgi:putative transposase
VHLGGCTANPDPAWVTQQARNLAREWLDVEGQVRFLVRDRDSKFTRAFDKVFRSEAVRVLRTPVRAPRANAYAERWIRTVRTECLDWLLILNRTHLGRGLRVYVGHYNHHRPHRGLGLDAPQGQRQLAAIACAGTGDVYRRDLLGGLLHEYYQAAA